MKQTQTHVWSLAGEEAVSYSLARGKAAAVTCHSLALADLGRAAPGQREITETVAQLPQPAQPRYHAWGARPKDHFIQRLAPECIIIIHKICITLRVIYVILL